MSGKQQSATRLKDPKTEKAFEYWRRNPVEAVKDWFKVTPEDYQARILNDCFVGDKDRVIAKSGHGVGKTTQSMGHLGQPHPAQGAPQDVVRRFQNQRQGIQPTGLPRREYHGAGRRRQRDTSRCLRSD